MNLHLITPALAQAAEPAARGGAPVWPMLLALFAIFYFFIIRPQSKKQKEMKTMMDGLEKGNKVITIGGIVGTILSIKEKRDAKTDDDILVLKVSDQSKIEMIRSSIARVLPKDGEAAKS